VDISLEMKLYRQQYCGCVFSERDRYLLPQKPKEERFTKVSKLITMINK
ncbi:MAG: epoxyqueuosine reductase QueH, partial [Phascolarctobacterium sp.]|nr:epoxyqueuosine reductase QueH [Phascolarctobacterium sp.]